MGWGLNVVGRDSSWYALSAMGQLRVLLQGLVEQRHPATAELAAGKVVDFQDGAQQRTLVQGLMGALVRSLAPADLVFFGKKGNVTHVGIYVGEGRFVHAPSTGGTVRLDHLDGPYWRDHYSGAKRVLR